MISIEVKNFIEQNIDLIEHESYSELFTLWYLQYYKADFVDDAILLGEVFDTLQSAGINIRYDSLEIRKDIIRDIYHDYIIDTFQREAETQTITFVGATNDLNSRLYLNLIELKKLFLEAAEKTPYVIQNNSVRRHS